MRKLAQIKRVGIVFTIISMISLLGVVSSNKAMLKKAKGIVAGINLRVYLSRKNFYSETSFKLEGSTKTFIVTEEGEANSFTDRVQVGDTVKLYSKTVLQFLIASFVRGNTFRVEKDGVTIYDEARILRTKGWIIFGMFALLSLISFFLYQFELKEMRRRMR